MAEQAASPLRLYEKKTDSIVMQQVGCFLPRSIFGPYFAMETIPSELVRRFYSESDAVRIWRSLMSEPTGDQLHFRLQQAHEKSVVPIAKLADEPVWPRVPWTTGELRTPRGPRNHSNIPKDLKNLFRIEEYNMKHWTTVPEVAGDQHVTIPRQLAAQVLGLTYTKDRHETQFFGKANVGAYLNALLREAGRLAVESAKSAGNAAVEDLQDAEIVIEPLTSTQNSSAVLHSGLRSALGSGTPTSGACTSCESPRPDEDEDQTFRTLKQVHAALCESGACSGADAAMLVKRARADSADSIPLATIQHERPSQYPRERHRQPLKRKRKLSADVAGKDADTEHDPGDHDAQQKADYFSDPEKLTVEIINDIFDKDEGAPFRQVVTTMMRTPCAHGLLTDAMLFSFLRLRRICSTPGEAGSSPTEWVLEVQTASWDDPRSDGRRSVFACMYNWLRDAAMLRDRVQYVKEFRKLAQEVQNQGSKSSRAQKQVARQQQRSAGDAGGRKPPHSTHKQRSITAPVSTEVGHPSLQALTIQPANILATVSGTTPDRSYAMVVGYGWKGNERAYVLKVARFGTPGAKQIENEVSVRGRIQDESVLQSLLPRVEDHGYDEECDHVGMVMERLPAYGCVPWEGLLAGDPKEAIQAAFEQLWRAGVSHGDVARRNIWVGRQGQVRVMDLGRATFVGSFEEAERIDRERLEALLR